MSIPETIDQGIFARFYESLGSDPEFLNEVIEEFFSSTPELFAKMEQAIAAGQPAGLQRAAHSLKTGSATFGALAFSARCKELEYLAKSGVLDGAGRMLSSLQASYPEVVASLKAQIEGARA